MQAPETTVVEAVKPKPKSATVTELEVNAYEIAVVHGTAVTTVQLAPEVLFYLPVSAMSALGPGIFNPWPATLKL